MINQGPSAKGMYCLLQLYTLQGAQEERNRAKDVGIQATVLCPLVRARVCASTFWGDKTIADSWLCKQIAGMSGVTLKLLAQPIDVYTQVLGFTSVLRTPDALQQHAMRDDLARVSDQLLQQ